MSRPTRTSPRKSSPLKRMVESDPEDDPMVTPPTSPSKKARKSPKTPSTPVQPALTGPVVDAPLTVPSHLGFNFEEAKRHLINADPRFEVMFRKVPCKPYEDTVDLETIEAGQRDAHNHVNPYRSLATSILGQQISWLAARAITHRFIRLYFPSLPEKYTPGQPADDFPTPLQVFQTPIAELRSAGLSQRKAEYLQDLSSRFADGRLTAEKLIAMSDEEMRAALIAVRGIGEWTCDMFSMFTMRRPNILAPGDLGLQKGLIRWLGYEKPVILPSKLVQPIKTEEPLVEPAVPAEATSDLPDIVLQPAAGTASSGQPAQIHADDFPPAPPFPPSETLTQEKLRARLSKKIKGNIYLSAKEMEELTAAWAPYRSLGLYYMWSLAGESGE